jgi:hypothetical protein
MSAPSALVVLVDDLLLDSAAWGDRHSLANGPFADGLILLAVSRG